MGPCFSTLASTALRIIPPYTQEVDDLMTDTQTPKDGGLDFDLTDIMNDEGARISDRVLPVPSKFSFVWVGTRFYAELDKIGENDEEEKTAVDQYVCLTLRADIAPVPYTAEDPAGRDAVLHFAHQLELVPGGQKQINARRRLEYVAKTRLSHPTRSADIITAATVVIMQSAPYFEHARASLPANRSKHKEYAAERGHHSLH